MAKKKDKTQELFLKYMASTFDVDDVKLLLKTPIKDKGLMFVTMIWGLMEAPKILDELTGHKHGLEDLFTLYLRGDFELEQDEADDEDLL